MPLPLWVASLFEPIANTIDELHTSKEEKAAAQVAVMTAQASLITEVLGYEAKMAEQQTRVILAEAQGQSWLQRNWRPLTMLTFVFIVAWNFVVAPLLSWLFAAPVPQLQMEAGFWTLLTVGLGGYVAGRSGEKIAATLSRPKP